MSAYKDRIAQGKCGISGCNNKPLANKSLCEEHQRKSAEKSAARRAARKTTGKCIVFGCNETEGLSAGGRCPTHLAAQSADAKTIVKRRKAAGLCASTGCKNKPKAGCVLCQEHIDQRSKVSSEHYQRRKKAGLCSFGNHPPLPGEALCAYHKQKAADYRAKLKLEVMTVYGEAKCSHPGCDCEDIDALELHHVAGGGCAHRREIGIASGGYNFYLWIRSEGYPPGYTALCPNHHKKADVVLRQGKLDCEVSNG